MYHARFKETGEEKMKELESELRFARRSVDQLSEEYLEMWQRLEKLEILLFMQQNVISQLSLAVVDPVPLQPPLPFPSTTFTGLTREDLYTPLSFFDTNPYLEDVYAITNHILEDLDQEEQEERAISALLSRESKRDRRHKRRSRNKEAEEVMREAQSWPSTPRHRSILTNKQEPNVRGSLEKTDSKESSDGRSIVLPPPVRTHLSRTLCPSKEQSVEEEVNDDNSYLSPPSPPPPEPGHVPDSIFSVSEYLEYRGESSSCVVISDSDLEDLDRFSYDLDMISRESSIKKSSSRVLDQKRGGKERKKQMSNERKRAMIEIGELNSRRMEQRTAIISPNEQRLKDRAEIRVNEGRKMSGGEDVYSILNRSSHSQQGTFAQISGPGRQSEISSNWIEKEGRTRTKREWEEDEDEPLLVDVTYKMGRKEEKVIEVPMSILPSTYETISSDLNEEEKLFQREQEEYDNLLSQLPPSTSISLSEPSPSSILFNTSSRRGDTIESRSDDRGNTDCDKLERVKKVVEKGGRRKSIKEEHERGRLDGEERWTDEGGRGRRTSLGKKISLCEEEGEIHRIKSSIHPSQSDLEAVTDQVTGNDDVVVTSDTFEKEKEELLLLEQEKMMKDIYYDEGMKGGEEEEELGINQKDDNRILCSSDMRKDEKVAQDQNELDQITAAAAKVTVGAVEPGQNFRPNLLTSNESVQNIIDPEHPLSLTQGQQHAQITSVPVPVPQDGLGGKMVEGGSPGAMIGRGRGPIVTSEGIFSSLTTSMSKGYQSVFSVPGTQQQETQLDDQQKRIIGSSNSLDQGFAQKSASVLTSSIGGFLGGFGIKSSPVRSQSVQQPQDPSRKNQLHQHSLPESVRVPSTTTTTDSISTSPGVIQANDTTTATGLVKRGSSTRRRHLNQSDRQQSIQSGDPSFPDETIPTTGPVTSKQFLMPNDGRKRGSRGEDSVGLGHLEQSLSEESGVGADNSRQSSFMLSEYGSLEDPEAESEKRVRTSFPTDDDSAFCSTIEEKAAEEQSSHSISPLPTSGGQTNGQVQPGPEQGQISAVVQLLKGGNKEDVGEEKRDSVSSFSGGFQNRFASIMKQKVEERKIGIPTMSAQEENLPQGEGEEKVARREEGEMVSNVPANSMAAVSVSQESTEEQNSEQGAEGESKAPVVGKKKWMVAVVRVLFPRLPIPSLFSLFPFSLLSSISSYLIVYVIHFS